MKTLASLALLTTVVVAPCVARAGEPATAPRVAATEADRRIARQAGILGLLAELDGPATRMVLASDALDGTLAALADVLVAAPAAVADRSRVFARAAAPAGSVSIGEVRVPTPADLSIAELRPHRTLGPDRTTVAWSGR